MRFNGVCLLVEAFKKFIDSIKIILLYLVVNELELAATENGDWLDYDNREDFIIQI